MLHLYVHVPFCRRRCSYCDFAIAVRRRVPARHFVDCVIAEFERRGDAEAWGGAVFETVYLGGGTPSLLGAEAARLLEALPRTRDAEVTLEANPDDVTPAAVQVWRAAGVNRVSLGTQSFEDRVLAWMHRTHDGATARAALEMLRDGGIGSVSADLIFALPPELRHDVRRDLDALLGLAPDHVSAYGLTREAQTPYARWMDRGDCTLPTDDRYTADFMTVHDVLSAAGFEHYEVSNYARPGARSRHNSAYWSGAEYVGLGPSAHGFHRGTRRWNLRHWAAYERCVSAGGDPVEGTEVPSPEQRELEVVLLGLRTAEGLPAADARKLNQEAILAAGRAGWLTDRDGRLSATLSGWLVLDGLLPALTTFYEGG